MTDFPRLQVIRITTPRRMSETLRVVANLMDFPFLPPANTGRFRRSAVDTDRFSPAHPLEMCAKGTRGRAVPGRALPQAFYSVPAFRRLNARPE